MTLLNLESYVIDQYFDLAELDKENHSILYTKLSDVKQQVFPDNYRIVFYYFTPLKRTYVDSAADIIDKLQEVLVYYDIPNFFVIIVTNDKNIGADLKYVYERYTKNELEPIKFIYTECLKSEHYQ